MIHLHVYTRLGRSDVGAMASQARRADSQVRSRLSAVIQRTSLMVYVE